MHMHQTLSRIATIGLALVSQTAALAVPSHPSPRALYFARANPAGETVVAIAIDQNGLLLNRTSVTSTHGLGNGGLLDDNPADGFFPPDILASQDSVIVEGNYLFTINPGSNTAVMFEINPFDPLELRIIGTPQPTIGTFPNAITYSAKYNTACVITGGLINGVTCYNVDPFKGLTPDGLGLRNTHFNFGAVPVHHGPNGSSSDIRFSPDSNWLLAVFKGNYTPATPANLLIYDVSPSGQVSTTFKNASSPLTSFAFGAIFDPNNQTNFYVSDAGFGGVYLHANPVTGETTTIALNSEPVNEFGGCWVVYSKMMNAFLEISLVTPTVAVINTQTGALDDLYFYSNSTGETINDPIGGIDTVINDHLLYFIRSATNSIAVLDIFKKEIIQEFYYSNTTDRILWTGLAIYTGPFQS